MLSCTFLASGNLALGRQHFTAVSVQLTAWPSPACLRHRTPISGSSCQRQKKVKLQLAARRIVLPSAVSSGHSSLHGGCSSGVDASIMLSDGLHIEPLGSCWRLLLSCNPCSGAEHRRPRDSQAGRSVRLQDELSDYVKGLPKTRLVRLKERRGLMLARMEGVWRSDAPVTIFLDSHIEATRGWIEPILARIAEDKRHVVVPSIDTLGAEDMVYRVGGGLGVLGFSWTLGQDPYLADTGGDGTRPAKSPVMAGGLFASDTREFLRLGGVPARLHLQVRLE
eukprot:s337_g4.t1